jgi:hypothetical protein
LFVPIWQPSQFDECIAAACTKNVWQNVPERAAVDGQLQIYVLISTMLETHPKDEPKAA